MSLKPSIHSRVFLSVSLLFPLFYSAHVNAGSFSPGTPSEVLLEAPRDREAFTVGILGDRTGGAPEDISVLADAVADMNRLRPDFAIMVGDMINGYTWLEEKRRGEVAEFKGVIGKLSCPFYPVSGNHDVLGGERSPLPTYEQQYRKEIGPLYYSFDYRNSHFVVLYSEDGGPGSISDEQIAWLDKDLGTNTLENVFVFLHRPVWVENPERWDKVHEILKQHSVRAVIGGHLHTLLKFKPRDGIGYYLIGSTGAFLHKTEEAGGFYQFAQLRVDGKEYSLSILPVGGVFPDDTMLAEDFYEGVDKIDGWENKETRILSVLSDPCERETNDNLKISVGNPTGRKCRVTIALDPERGPWEAEPMELDVEGGGSATAELKIHCPQTVPKDLVPPDLLFTYYYPGVRGNIIPETFRRRVPVERSIELARLNTRPAIDGHPEPVWSASAKVWTTHWTYSSYNPRNEENVRVFMLVSGGDLYFAAKVNDLERSFLDRPPGRALLGDYFRLAGTDGEGKPHAFLFFPFDPQKRLYVAGKGRDEWNLVGADSKGFEFAFVADAQGYAVEGKIALESLFGSGDLQGTKRRFNIWIADDDFHGFPLDRCWASPESENTWGTILFR